MRDEATAHDIDSEIEYWHTHDIGITLPEYLGLTPDEYEEYAKSSDDDAAITRIIEKRKMGK